MTYTHLTPNELVMIEAYFHQETPVAIVAKQLKRGRQTIYNVYNFLKCGGWNGNSFFDKFYKVQNFFPYAIPIVLDNEPPRM